MNGVQVLGRAALAAAIAAIVGLSTAPSAAGQAVAGPGAADAYRKGRQAIELGVGSNLSLGSFQGKLVSYRRFVSDRTALRLSATLSLDVNDSDKDVELGTEGEESSASLTNSEHEVGVTAQLLFYRGEAPVLFYYGLGPTVSYSDYHLEDIQYGLSGGDIYYRYSGSKGHEWLLGVQGVVGVEWALSERFALHGEYGLTASYTIGKSSSTFIRTDTPSDDTFTETRSKSPDVSSDGVLVGLSVFF